MTIFPTGSIAAINMPLNAGLFSFTSVAPSAFIFPADSNTFCLSSTSAFIGDAVMTMDSRFRENDRPGDSVSTPHLAFFLASAAAALYLWRHAGAWFRAGGQPGAAYAAAGGIGNTGEYVFAQMAAQSEPAGAGKGVEGRKVKAALRELAGQDLSSQLNRDMALLVKLVGERMQTIQRLGAHTTLEVVAKGVVNQWANGKVKGSKLVGDAYARYMRYIKCHEFEVTTKLAPCSIGEFTEGFPPDNATPLARFLHIEEHGLWPGARVRSIHASEPQIRTVKAVSRDCALMFENSSGRFSALRFVSAPTSARTNAPRPKRSR